MPRPPRQDALRRFALRLLRGGLGLKPLPRSAAVAPVATRLAHRTLFGLAIAFTTAAATPPKATPVIQGIAWRAGGLVVQASAPLQPQIFMLSNPHRFVVDLPDADLGDANLAHAIPVNNGSIKQIRLARQPNGTVRLVVDCTRPTPLQVMQLNGRATLVLVRADEPPASLAALLGTQVSSDHAGGQELKRLWSREVGDKLELHLDAAKPLAYSLFLNDGQHAELRVPAGRFSGFLPLPGKHLAGTRVRATDSMWTLDTAVKDGSYQLDQSLSADRTHLTLTWTKVDPHRFANRPLVVIDPGHGGTDPGALGPGGSKEKTACLELAFALQHALLSHKFNVVMTRTTDAEMYLEPRLKMIDQVHADYFISLHANSHTTPDSTGTEAFWREPASKEFAATVQSAVTTLLHRQDRGVKQERLYVLRHTRVPSLLLESGFISNPGEERMLASKDFQSRAAEAIVAGVERAVAASNNPALGSASQLGAHQ